MLYSAGDCPVCSRAGDLLFVRDPISRRIFFYCPACGCAWTSPPPPHTLDSIEAIGVYAPKGIDLPTLSDIVANGMEAAIERSPDDEEWVWALEEILMINVDADTTLDTFSLR